MQKKTLASLALLAASAVTLTGCAGSPGSSGSSAATADGVQIVASTDVWGNIASVVAGSDATVTSIIDSPDKDPHEYEATSRDQLAISKADLVIENGGGYDPFIDKLLDASGSKAPLISAVVVSGLLPADDHAESPEPSSSEGTEHAADDDGHVEGFNEHVFYDLPTAAKVADEIADQLATIDSAHASGYRDRAAAFGKEIAALEASAKALAPAAAGKGELITEPVPLYLLDLIGLKNLTPASFSEAIEEDSDVSPADLQTVLDLIKSGQPALLAYNEQATTAQTETVEAAAKAANIPVVGFTETLPAGDDYLGWMKSNIEAVSSALSK